MGPAKSNGVISVKLVPRFPESLQFSGQNETPEVT